MGAIGKIVFLSGFQYWFSIIIGSLLIVFAILYFFTRYNSPSLIINTFNDYIKKRIIHLLKQHSIHSFYLLGLSNGLLPCGLVYLALSWAINSTTVFTGTGYMFAFGIGTIPALFTLSYLGNVFTLKARNFFKKIFPFIIILMGLILIARGLSLNIKFISPILPTEKTKEASSCH